MTAADGLIQKGGVNRKSKIGPIRDPPLLETSVTWRDNESHRTGRQTPYPSSLYAHPKHVVPRFSLSVPPDFLPAVASFPGVQGTPPMHARYIKDPSLLPNILIKGRKSKAQPGQARR